MSKEQNEQQVNDEREDEKKQASKVKINIDSDAEAKVTVKYPDGAAEVVINSDKTESAESEKSRISGDSEINGKNSDSFQKAAQTTPDGAARHSATSADEEGESSEKRGNVRSDHKTSAKDEKGLGSGKDSEKLKNELDEKDQQLRKAQQSLLETELKVLKLEGEIQRLNDQYTKKVTEKALEAQKLVDKRLSELQEEFSSKATEAKKYALTSGAGKLAELLQNFEMVLSTSQKAGEAVKNYSQGFVMVFEMMNKTLAELGITPIDVKPGDDFDHDTMEIFEGVDTKDFKHNQVVEVLKKGYRLHDKVIAHAIVKVAN